MESNIYLRDFKFPGGEVHVQLDLEKVAKAGSVQFLPAVIKSSDDIMKLIMTTDALRRAGFQDIILLMPYVPYARQDRVSEIGEPLSIAAFAKIINSLKFLSVLVWDAHSDVATAVIDNCKSVPQYRLVDSVLGPKQKDYVLVSPDAGARKKIDKLAQLWQSEVIYCDKVRDTKTGKILYTHVPDIDEKIIEGKGFLIVDDICDGGRTFTELAKVLQAKNPDHWIDLYVTHAILSQGLSTFKGLIDNIYTVNCWYTPAEVAAFNKVNTTQIHLLDPTTTGPTTPGA